MLQMLTGTILPLNDPSDYSKASSAPGLLPIVFPHSVDGTYTAELLAETLLLPLFERVFRVKQLPALICECPRKFTDRLFVDGLSVMYGRAPQKWRELFRLPS